MDKSLVLEGRVVSPAELAAGRGLLAAHPEWSRFRLLRELCALWNWRAPNGQLQDLAARTLLLKLAARGQVALPAKRLPSPNRMRHKQLRPVAHDDQPITEPLAHLRPLQVTELSQCPDGLALFEWLLHPPLKLFVAVCGGPIG